jgi:glycine/D-amino acid oxidase-like deaminating enzyme
MQAALAAARKQEIPIHGNAEVTAMRRNGERVEVIVGWTRHIARAAVNCRGAWAGQPARPRKGQMLSLRPRQPDLLQHSVVAPDVYLVPRSSGRILIGATVEDAGYDHTVEPHVIHQLHRAAAQLIPDLGSLPVEESWAGLRPGSPDDLPLLGETDTPGVFIATGHFRNGILLAPVTARIIANLITGRQAGTDISAFSPARFITRR